MNYLLGIDVGTSGVKALLISKEGQVISSKSVSYPLTSLHPGWAEQLPLVNQFLGFQIPMGGWDKVI